MAGNIPRRGLVGIAFAKLGQGEKAAELFRF